jgi:multisubunit Na+/H+ antiporter MnhF subunit
MTVISIVKLTQSNRGFASWVDDVLALDAFIFLTSSIFSYLSIRSRSKKIYFEDIADKMFMLALILMGASVLLLTYEIV